MATWIMLGCIVLLVVLRAKLADHLKEANRMLGVSPILS